MKKLNFVGLIGVLLVLSAFTIKISMDWKIADNYSVKFKGVEATGVFTELKGDFIFDENKLSEAKFNTSVAVSSLNTGNGTRNKHAKGEKWLDGKKYPQIIFTSKEFSKKNDGFEVTGTLEMHGIKKEISMPFTFKSNTIVGTFKVKRLDFKVGTMQGINKKVANEIEIQFSVPLTKK